MGVIIKFAISNIVFKFNDTRTENQTNRTLKIQMQSSFFFGIGIIETDSIVNDIGTVYMMKEETKNAILLF
jgi:hypothetical protein